MAFLQVFPSCSLPAACLAVRSLPYAVASVQQDLLQRCMLGVGVALLAGVEGLAAARMRTLRLLELPP